MHLSSVSRPLASLMAASKNLLISSPHHHHQWRSRKPSGAALMVSSCLLTLPVVFFIFLPHTSTTTTTFTPPHSMIFPSSHLHSLTSLSSFSAHIPDPTRLSLRSCDLFNGSWVADRSGPYYPPGSCPHVDDAFNCVNNGRRNTNYLNYRWAPHGCQLPRLDGRRLLNALRNKRMVFVGDSLNRNMWQSLICSLRHSLTDKSSLLEVNRSSISKLYFSFFFKEYNCSIDYVKSPFLVQRWRIKGSQGFRRETLRLDMIQEEIPSYQDAHIMVFNTGHWWTHHKTRNGIGYFEEGGNIHNKLKLGMAFRRALQTWAHWVDSHIDANRTLVFFVGYSASHFRGGRWNSGGSCDGETEPITEESQLSQYPWMMKAVESVVSEMQTPVMYLNITRMSEYRKDAHPSVHRQPRRVSSVQDCSHWCLPGVPDSWNQLLYAYLLKLGRL